jgi:isoleucyl-tRNA synthetase
VIFRATEQWFISMEFNGLREKCLVAIEEVKWVPTWGRDRIFPMVKNRPDWCISRQRSWGVPIAVLMCGQCAEVVVEDSVMDKVVGMFAERGADAWFEVEAAEILPAGYKCKKCSGTGFVKEMDILDVWFDSGVSHAAVLEADPRLGWPADMYLEGSDQHRGWFQSSLIAATGTRAKSPFKTILTHGFVVDGKGKKMSKSVGNVVAPQDIIKKSGAEIVRLWVAAEDYRNDVRISNEIMQRLTEAYRKIRNTCRYLLGNTSDFDHTACGCYGSLLEIDRWALSRTHRLIRDVTASYESFEFHEVFHAVYNFCIVDMSSFYLDILKDRLYTSGRKSKERRAAQWTMLQILSVMTRLMAPILSFTAEEVWRSMLPRGAKGRHAESVFLSRFPQFNHKLHNEELERKWAGLIKVREVVNKALELKRAEKFIGNSLEARVTVYADDATCALLRAMGDFLPTLFIVSQAEVRVHEPGDAADEIRVTVEKSEGKKCARCWNISATVGSFPDAPDICQKCHAVVGQSDTQSQPQS